MSYKLQKPYTEKQKTNFIAEYGQNCNGRRTYTMSIEKTADALYALEPWEKLVNGQVVDNREEYEAELAEQERERIQSLSMTRSDFFDGTIKAFGADSEDLLKAIEYVLAGLEIADVDKKVALNNYKNALNFYRKHPLFTMLADVEIPIREGVSITISSEQWDGFFDETDKKNPEAYKELLPSDPQMTHNGEAENQEEKEYSENYDPQVTHKTEIENEDTIITDELSI